MNISEMIGRLERCRELFGDVLVVCIPRLDYHAPEFSRPSEEFDIRDREIDGKLYNRVLHI